MGERLPTHDAAVTRSCFKSLRFELDIELFIVAFVQNTEFIGNMYNVLMLQQALHQHNCH